MGSLDAFITGLPKAELHVHLVGSASAPTVLELARRHKDSMVPRSAPELRAFYEFRDFPHFSDVYGAVSDLVHVAALALGRPAAPRASSAIRAHGGRSAA